MNRRNSGSRSRNNPQASIGSTFVTLGIMLIVGIVLSFMMWTLANQKVVAVNASSLNLADSKTGDEKLQIGPNEYLLPPKGELLGYLRIPSINLELPIYVGDSDEELAKGVGMDTRMRYPGQDGNVVLSGHTNTMFKTLGEANDGDEVSIETTYATYTYRIASHEIVLYNDENVIVPKPSEFLTIYTCYPFNFLASTDQRYVVRCDFVDEQVKNELKSESE